jgi:hypothetical protein
MSLSAKSVSTTLLALLVAASILGCPLKKKKTDTVDEDEPIADAATVTVSGTGAKNERDISRYQKEEKLADEPAVIVKDSVKVKSFPGGGNDVATLAKGTAVTKIAKYFSTAVLVTFDDPSGDGTKLLGWVLPAEIGTEAAAATGQPAVVKPVVKPVTTSVVTLDAGAKDAALKDAGPAAPADAGKPVAAADAGAGNTPAPVSTTALFVPTGADGKCPPGFAASGGGCRRPCNADTDCPRKTFCVATSGKKFCQASK